MAEPLSLVETRLKITGLESCDFILSYCHSSGRKFALHECRGTNPDLRTKLTSDLEIGSKTSYDWSELEKFSIQDSYC